MLFCDNLFDFLSLKTDVNVPSKSNEQKNFEKTYFFVCNLKATDEKSRIRLRYSVVQIHGSGSVPKCHGSTKLFNIIVLCCPGACPEGGAGEHAWPGVRVRQGALHGLVLQSKAFHHSHLQVSWDILFVGYRYLFLDVAPDFSYSIAVCDCTIQAMQDFLCFFLKYGTVHSLFPKFWTRFRVCEV